MTRQNQSKASSQSKKTPEHSSTARFQAAAPKSQKIQAKAQDDESKLPDWQPSPNAYQVNQQNPLGGIFGHSDVNTADVPVQGKLTIGQPGDKYEQEADSVAKDVVQRINSGPNTQQEESVQRSVLPIHSLPIQRSGSVNSGPVNNEFENSLNQSRSGGSGIDPVIRTKMESAMGADFSRVRIHNDMQSDQLSQSIQAKAFTTGNDIFFKQGEYNPSSRGGQELLAHELTHVVQQQGPGLSSVQRDTEEFPDNEMRGGQTIENTLVKAAAKAGIEHATKMAHRAYQKAMIVKNNDDSRAAYIKWFGAYDESPEALARWKLVTETTNKIIAGLMKAVNFYWAKPSMDSGGLWAYVYPDKPGNIFLGQMFMEKYTTKDAQEGVGGTIIHEISHYVNGTRDHKYGAECLGLAASEPEKAVRNADSYLFFAEEFMDTRWER